MLVGTAVGDAFGAGIEFQGAEWIRRNVDFTRWVNVRGRYFTWEPFSSQNFVSGMYTDDTEMMVGVMKALVAGEATADGLLKHWKREYDLAPTHYLSTRLWSLVGVGRQGHGARFWAKVYGGEKSIVEVREMQRGRRYPGNAPAMRSIPLSYLGTPKERWEAACTNADATHPHPKARLASFLVAEAAWYVRAGGGTKGVIEHVRTYASRLAAKDRDAETLEYLLAVERLPDYHACPKLEGLDLKVLCGPQPIEWATKMRGSPVHGVDSDAMRTLGVVLYLVKWARGPWDGLQHAMWIGGDVDSTGGLVLGILAGRDGLRAGEDGGIPLWLLEDLEALEYLVEVADEFEQWSHVRSSRS